MIFIFGCFQLYTEPRLKRVYQTTKFACIVIMISTVCCVWWRHNKETITLLKKKSYLQYFSVRITINYYRSNSRAIKYLYVSTGNLFSYFLSFHDEWLCKKYIYIYFIKLHYFNTPISCSLFIAFNNIFIVDF